jgi:hypothetical protein
LRPFVDFVARIQARLETQLLGGFLAISLLMLALGIVALFAVTRMGGQIARLDTLQLQLDNANNMPYDVTAQSHSRTMALLTGDRCGQRRFPEPRQGIRHCLRKPK